MEKEDEKEKLIAELCNATNAQEGVFLAMHAIALEIGFSANLSDWRQGNNFVSEIRHYTCEDVACRLLGTCISKDMMFIYGYVNDKQVCKFQINCSAFTSEAFQISDVETFSRVIKDNVLHCLLASAQHSAGCPSTFGFEVLPIELTYRILSNLPGRDVAAISSVNHQLHDLAEVPELWESLFKRDFSDSAEVASATKSWKQLYKEKFLQRRGRRKLMMNSGFSILPPLPLPFPGFPGPRPIFPEPIVPQPMGPFPRFQIYHDPGVAASFPNLIRRARPLRVPRPGNRFYM